MDDSCFEPLGELLQNNKNIKEINLSFHRSKITDAGIQLFVSYLSGNTTLKQINFQSCRRITNKSVPFFKEFAENSNLEYLNVIGTMIKTPQFFVIPLARNILKNGGEIINFNGM